METFSASSIDKDSDRALVAAAKRGHVQAFEQLVLHHQHRVLALAQRITKNREDAEDVSQESFQKAFLHLHGFQEHSRFSTWLTRIVMNEAFMVLRRRRKGLEVGGSDDDVKSASEVLVDQSPNPEESCWRRERTEILTGAIHRLGPRFRRTILLRLFAERSVEETAQVLGISTAAVKSRLFHGCRQLRRPMNLGRWRAVFSVPPRKGAVRRRSAAQLA
jgi:RNA polymerase sigma-70 factor, ECF subfamily